MITSKAPYTTYAIAPKKLSEYISCYKVYQFQDNTPVKLNPEGYFELIFQLNNDFLQRISNSMDWQKRPNSFIGGLHSKSYYIRPESKKATLISVNFKPNCARFFIHEYLHHFKNSIVQLDSVYTPSKVDGLQRLHEVNSIEKGIDIIEAFLIQNFNKKAPSAIDHSLEILNNHHGFMNIGELSRSSALSISQFRKRFNEEVGMSPKEYSKVLRINYIGELLSKDQYSSLTRLTYELGYFDQSHFIRDFKSVTGLSPKKYLA